MTDARLAECGVYSDDYFSFQFYAELADSKLRQAVTAADVLRNSLLRELDAWLFMEPITNAIFALYHKAISHEPFKHVVRQLDYLRQQLLDLLFDRSEN